MYKKQNAKNEIFFFFKAVIDLKQIELTLKNKNSIYFKIFDNKKLIKLSKNHKIEKNQDKILLTEKIEFVFKVIYDIKDKIFFSKKFKLELFSLYLTKKKLGFFNLDISGFLNKKILNINNRIKIKNKNKRIFLDFFLNILLIKTKEKKFLKEIPEFLLKNNNKEKKNNFSKKKYSEFVKDLLKKKTNEKSKIFSQYSNFNIEIFHIKMNFKKEEKIIEKGNFIVKGGRKKNFKRNKNFRKIKIKIKHEKKKKIREIFKKRKIILFKKKKKKKKKKKNKKIIKIEKIILFKKKNDQKTKVKNQKFIKVIFNQNIFEETNEKKYFDYTNENIKRKNIDKTEKKQILGKISKNNEINFKDKRNDILDKKSKNRSIQNIFKKIIIKKKYISISSPKNYIKKTKIYPKYKLEKNFSFLKKKRKKKSFELKIENMDLKLTNLLIKKNIFLEKKNNFEKEKKFLDLKVDSNNKEINKMLEKIKKKHNLNKKYLLDYHNITDKIFDLKINKENLIKEKNHLYQKIDKILLMIKSRNDNKLEKKIKKIINQNN